MSDNIRQGEYRTYLVIYCYLKLFINDTIGSLDIDSLEKIDIKVFQFSSCKTTKAGLTYYITYIFELVLKYKMHSYTIQHFQSEKTSQ